MLIIRVQVPFPLIGDEKGEIAAKIGMLDAGTDKKVTVRGVFVIDPDKRIKAIICYPASTGRNFDEIIRLIDSLQVSLISKSSGVDVNHFTADCGSPGHRDSGQLETWR